MLRRIVVGGCFVLTFVHASAFGQEKPKSLAERFAEAEADIKALQRWILELSSNDVPQTRAWVNCNTGAYHEVRPTDGHLVFLVSCEKIEPHLEGYRLTLLIGNPYAVSFSGVDGGVSYGEDLLRAVRQRISFSIASDLRPGAWTSTQVVVTPAMAEDVRFVGVDIRMKVAVARPDR